MMTLKCDINKKIRYSFVQLLYFIVFTIFLLLRYFYPGDINAVKCYKYFKSMLFSRETKGRLHMTIVRPSVPYGCRVCTTTLQLEKKVISTFENNVLRKVCSPVFNSELNVWCKRTKAELREIT